MEGGLGLLRQAVCAPSAGGMRRSLRAAARGRLRGGFHALAPAAGLARPAEAPVAAADDLDLPDAAAGPEPGGTESRGRASRPPARRTAGARRPAAKGGRGRGRGGRPHPSHDLTPRRGLLPAMASLSCRPRGFVPSAAFLVSNTLRAARPGQSSR